ncbi:hypothetical protein SDC9_154157 [bioreactor metagenome]|uniref:Uncharacterized protein n=1 Tax=bioreactor metagenome TaxID=1076179 RepID=A0A645EZJ1_9ZZZZ
MCQQAQECFPPFLGNEAEPLFGKLYLKFIVLDWFGEPADCFRMTICVRKVRLNVIDRSVIQQVYSRNLQNRAEIRMQLDAVKFDRGKPEGIRTEGGTRSENTHPRIPA